MEIKQLDNDRFTSSSSRLGTFASVNRYQGKPSITEAVKRLINERDHRIEETHKHESQKNAELLPRTAYVLLDKKRHTAVSCLSRVDVQRPVADSMILYCAEHVVTLTETPQGMGIVPRGIGKGKCEVTEGAVFRRECSRSVCVSFGVGCGMTRGLGISRRSNAGLMLDESAARTIANQTAFRSSFTSIEELVFCFIAIELGVDVQQCGTASISEPDEFPMIIEVDRGARIHIRPRKDSLPEHGINCIDQENGSTAFSRLAAWYGDCISRRTTSAAATAKRADYWQLTPKITGLPPATLISHSARIGNSGAFFGYSSCLAGASEPVH